MSFGCTIKAGNTKLTGFDDDTKIHYQLMGLAPNGSYATDAPYRLDDLRSVVAGCTYGDRLKDAAQDCFRELQSMAAANLASLTEPSHCESCTCGRTRKDPTGWSAEDIEAFLKIDPNTVTYISGGW